MINMKKVRNFFVMSFLNSERFFACFVLLFFCNCINGQSQVSEILQQQFKDYNQQRLREKLFAHTDKTFYLTGETLWFKLYNVEANEHTPISISKVAYVEVMNNAKRPVLQAKIELKDGFGDGSFVLPASLNSGSYVLRAYTNWMKNFDENFYFQKAITIVNTGKRPDWQSLEKKESYQIHFFPEGGNLVYHLQSKIAFHITDQYGKGVEGTGAVTNTQNDTVAKFRSLQFGMGNFYFIPQSFNDYKVTVRLNNGEVITSSLPQAYKEGLVMQLSSVDTGHLQVIVHSSDAASNSLVYLLIHTRQTIKMVVGKKLNAGMVEWIVDKSLLGDGISNLILFNEARQPLCERLYFKRPVRKMNIDVRANSNEYEVRSKVGLKLATSNKKGELIDSHLSLSVFRIDSLQQQDANTIESFLWLTSDLQGCIESPLYYFENKNSREAEEATDNLMLTNGWRRFRWDNIIKGEKPMFQFLPEYEGLILQAKLTDKNSGEPVAGVKSFLSVPAEKFHVANAVSNKDGKAAFVIKNIYGPGELILQTDSNSNRYRTELLNSYTEKNESLFFTRFYLPENWKNQLAYHNINTQLFNAFQPVHFQQFAIPAVRDTNVFYGNPDKKYLLDDFTRFPTMEEVMREFIAEVRVRKEKDDFHYEVLNIPYQSHFDSDPLVLIDGVPVYNINKIVSFDPLKIKKVEVVARKYFWGNTVNNGIVSYTTYNGDLAGFELDPDAVILEFQGLQLKREFYHPDYSTADKRSSRLPDARNVLCWMPNVELKEGKKEVSFYTSDVSGTYAITVQGINASGFSGSNTILISVKE
jgi:hypothetical protein